MLIFCSWEDRVSLLVDADNIDDAVEIVTDLAGLPPTRAVALPRHAFVAEWQIEVSEEEEKAAQAEERLAEGEFTLSPLDHTDEILTRYEAASTGEEVALEPDRCDRCEEEADVEDGAVVRCELDDNHGGAHQSGRFTW